MRCSVLLFTLFLGNTFAALTEKHGEGELREQEINTVMVDDFDSPVTSWVYTPCVFGLGPMGTGDMGNLWGEHQGQRYGKRIDNENGHITTGGLKLQFHSKSKGCANAGFELEFELDRTIVGARIKFDYHVHWTDERFNVAPVEAASDAAPDNPNANNEDEAAGGNADILHNVMNDKGIIYFQRDDEPGVAVDEFSAPHIYEPRWKHASIDPGILVAHTPVRMSIGGFLNAENSNGALWQIRLDNFRIVEVDFWG
ncbi:expressed unknown protein [Seminavis robusta]|uniref:Uncharacterized protein n=1 Tax=Seminavis robusta TaxID=568900 RepID=A0A9N8DX17_9STRA|nr:expressed unknown protein [Seminavis robusta]|eukprot:Sro429_g141040.1 n/a (255) ;mRNA; f:22099-23013